MPRIDDLRLVDASAAMSLKKLFSRGLMLSDDQSASQLHLTITWVTLACFLVVDAIWLSLSRLAFAASNWDGIFRLLLCTLFVLALCGWMSNRLTNNTDVIAGPLRGLVKRISLLMNAILVFGLLGTAVITFCCLGTSAALPLQDAMLAAIDQRLGFDWVAFVGLANTSHAISWLLVKAYQSTGYVLVGGVVWLCVSGQNTRLAELLALLCLTSVGIAVGMMILPAGGAYSYYKPPHDIYSNFSHDAGMWHYNLLMSFRTAAAPVIDFTTPNSNCLVTFPSGHTILAIITTYALRGSWWTFIPALLLNGTMVVSTIPEGGHHLFDLIVGGAIAAGSIAIVRIPYRVERRSSATAHSNTGLANA